MACFIRHIVRRLEGSAYIFHTSNSDEYSSRLVELEMPGFVSNNEFNSDEFFS